MSTIKHPPTLSTECLILRPFTMEDAPRVKELAGAREVYATTLNVPHPYEDGMAEKWIASHASQFYQGTGLVLAITHKESGDLLGAIGLRAEPAHRRAELGYWIGVPYWGNGYCTEAAKTAIGYAFTELGYHKITARHMIGNPASCRVMVKVGMRKEGELADELLKDGVFHSVGVYGLINPRNWKYMRKK